MPSMRTFVVGRVVGEIVVATSYRIDALVNASYSSASLGFTKSIESSRATGSLVMCPFAALTPSRMASLCCAAARAPSDAICI